MNRVKILVATAVVLSFGAGALVGIGKSRMGSHPDWKDHGPGHGPMEMHLGEELGLNSDQETKVRAIWSNLMDNFPQEMDRQRAEGEKYRQDVLALLTPEQKKQFDQIEADYKKHSEELETSRHKAFENAVEETKKVLTPEQRTKYEEIMARHHGPGDPGGPPPGGPFHEGDHGGPPPPPPD